MSSLADDVIDSATDKNRPSARGWSGDIPKAHAQDDVTRVAGAVRMASRYKLGERANQFVEDCANRILDDDFRQLQHIHMPSGLCWFEFPWRTNANAEEIGDPSLKTRNGILWVGRYNDVRSEDWNDEIFAEVMENGSTTQGTIIMVAQSSSGPIIYTAAFIDMREQPVAGMADYEYSPIRVHRKTADELIANIGTDGYLSYLDHQCCLTAALGMVLTSPKIATPREVEFDKLNKQRLRKGKPPLLSHKDVVIDLPRMSVPRPDTVSEQTEAEKHGKVRHFVSLFTRMRLGRLEVVRPHWRGDESLGVKMPAYRIKKGD